MKQRIAVYDEDYWITFWEDGEIVAAFGVSEGEDYGWLRDAWVEQEWPWNKLCNAVNAIVQ